MTDDRRMDLSPLVQSAARQFDQGSRFTYAFITPDLIIEQADQDFARMIGRPGEALTGRALKDLLWEFVGLEDVLRDILEGKRRRFQLKHINRVQSDGSTHYQTFLVAPFEASRPGQGLLLLVEDTTDYGRLHQDLVQDRNELRLVRQKLAVANRELERVSRMKSFLMSMAAHDLKGPLTSILGFATFLKEDITDAEQLEFLDIIVGQSDRMQRLIDNLLDFDQIEQGLLVLDWRDCNLNDVVYEVLNALRPSAEIRNQSIIFNQPELPFVIWADSNRLTQIVYNLTDNAVKFTPNGGQVRISLRRQKSDVEIEVTDTGPGLSHDQIVHLFDQYYRTAEIRRSNVRGSGLGLYIVKTLTEAHKGTISVESEVGLGTTMTVSLPVGEEGTVRNHAGEKSSDN